MVSTLQRFVGSAFCLLFLLTPAFAQGAAAGGAAGLLPASLGEFRADRADAAPAEVSDSSTGLSPVDYGVTSTASRRYVSPSGASYLVTIRQTQSNGAAYSLLTRAAGSEGGVGPHPLDLGGAEAVSHVALDSVSFVKGRTYVSVASTAEYADAGRRPGSDEINALARNVAAAVEDEAGVFPVLVQHLPDWERARGSAAFAVSLPALKAAVNDEPALDALSFEGGAEAATALYGGARVVVVEFTTPQYASDNDARINERIAELRAAGQPVPTAYRREGNYAVFVFDAADVRAADSLLGQVKYEKDVRWLGRNPHEQEMREEHVTSTMGGVIVTTLKVTGLAIILCLGVGGLFGGAVFLVRRSRTAGREVYTDAGGMLRLNLEDAGARPDPSKLLKSGSKG